jgi:hypothetical protein
MKTRRRLGRGADSDGRRLKPTPPPPQSLATPRYSSLITFSATRKSWRLSLSLSNANCCANCRSALKVLYARDVTSDLRGDRQVGGNVTKRGREEG